MGRIGALWYGKPFDRQREVNVVNFNWHSRYVLKVFEFKVLVDVTVGYKIQP